MQAFYLQVTAHLGSHTVGFDHAAPDRRVAAAGKAHPVAGAHAAVGVAGVAAVGLASAAGRADVEQQAASPGSLISCKFENKSVSAFIQVNLSTYVFSGG
nr:hypothetical protein [uncultured Variovorax sp.]